MSRIIKKIIKYSILHFNIFVVVGIILLLLSIFKKNTFAIVFMSSCFFMITYLKICIDVYLKLDQSRKLFTATSKVRNVDYLVIGDLVDTSDLYKDNKLVVELCAPDRNIDASYELLRHTYSILKSNGKVIIACKKKNVFKTGYSIFDTMYFHPVTLKRLGIGKENKFLKLMCVPLQVIKLIYSRRRKYKMITCESEAICKFCKERDLQLEYRECI